MIVTQEEALKIMEKVGGCALGTRVYDVDAAELTAFANALIAEKFGEPVAGYIQDKDGTSVTFEMDLVEQGMYAPLYAPRKE